MAVTNAIIKAGEKALTKGSDGAGVSSLASKAGSTLDGILGRSSGLTLPEPKVTPKPLSKYTEEVLGEPLNSVGSVMNNMDYTLADMKADKALSRKNYEIVKNNAREAADIMNPVENMNVLGVTSKSGLPALNRQQYYEDTIGSLRLPDGSKNPYVSGKDVPDYMQNHLSNDTNVERAVMNADLVIGSVLIPGGSTPKLFKKKYLPEMKNGAVFVDVAIDQGGCGESSHVTTHDDPVYVEDGVVHYCVGNMPGAVPRTSTIALTNATLRYGLQIAAKGLEEACKESGVIASGVNCYAGKITNKNVALALGYDCTELNELI